MNFEVSEEKMNIDIENESAESVEPECLVNETDTEGKEETADMEVMPEEETQADMDGTPEAKAAPKKSFFPKKKDKKDEQIEELTDRLKRNMAEFDNFRKRTEKEKSAMYEIGSRDIVEKILPVVDNFERGLATIPQEDEKSAFADGMDKIYKQMIKVLEDAGVKPIDAVDQPFDPNLHNAVMHVEDESLGENVVAEELLKGYTYKETVVRHSMVKVAN